MNTNAAATINNYGKFFENSWDVTLDGQPTRIRRIVTSRTAYFEVLRGNRWSRIDTMKAADAIAAAK
jgi:hypothetical protein